MQEMDEVVQLIKKYSQVNKMTVFCIFGFLELGEMHLLVEKLSLSTVLNQPLGHTLP